jgi:hypothetical protein
MTNEHGHRNLITGSGNEKVKFKINVRNSNVLTKIMKKTPRRSITVMSSLNEISTDQLGNRMVLVGGGGGRYQRG